MLKCEIFSFEFKDRIRVPKITTSIQPVGKVRKINVQVREREK